MTRRELTTAIARAAARELGAAAVTVPDADELRNRDTLLGRLVELLTEAHPSDRGHLARTITAEVAAVTAATLQALAEQDDR